MNEHYVSLHLRVNCTKIFIKRKYRRVTRKEIARSFLILNEKIGNGKFLLTQENLSENLKLKKLILKNI
jgi:hypothetical protein